MKEEKNTAVNNDENTEQELDLDDLEQVTGGSIRNVQYTKTTEISDDTKSKI